MEEIKGLIKNKTFEKLYKNSSRSSGAWILTFSVVATAIYSLQRLGVSLPIWINNYVNDFLCMPIVLFVCQFGIRKIKRNNNIRLSLPIMLSLSLYYAIYFEYFLPKVSLRYTADPIDVLLYFIGALFFYVIEKRSIYRR
ncbi:hypothetical protein SAMN04487911_11226 [Arenibacter nanhaiticus]|uniref:Magnesium citrate secondary transporter n=1 Tax=Arenibacter nanhaiticus TaxID=558155 RepID=A0A1M6GWG6_9FLAO|nr:hypothetical protein [Arenibacter nanhaiticus]SHJ14215.1 hypothetical protein SAMN04487911_11226 [Arenibacter nanhaiticus]